MSFACQTPNISFHSFILGFASACGSLTKKSQVRLLCPIRSQREHRTVFSSDINVNLNNFDAGDITSGTFDP
eukprot:SAG11_NODE_28890_length_316_cov_1.788018_1_plen_71_part_10